MSFVLKKFRCRGCWGETHVIRKGLCPRCQQYGQSPMVLLVELSFIVVIVSVLANLF